MVTRDPDRSAREPSYRILAARQQDLPWLPEIELAAAALLVGHAPASVLNETTAEQHFREAQAQGRLWVALAGETPVGFAHVEIFGSGAAHLEEIDVHPGHGRRGLGTRLVAAVCEWAARSGYRELTLTTFRDVPWNRPFYARLGFREVPTQELSAELLAVVLDETRRGLDPTRRVVMRSTVPSGGSGRAPLPRRRPPPHPARRRRWKPRSSPAAACASSSRRLVFEKENAPGSGSRRLVATRPSRRPI